MIGWTNGRGGKFCFILFYFIIYYYYYFVFWGKRREKLDEVAWDERETIYGKGFGSRRVRSERKERIG